MCSQTFLTASEREDSETPRKSLRTGETGLNLKTPELGLGEARGCFTGFGFAFGFGLATAVVDLEREAAVSVVAAVGGFFLATAAAVAAEEEEVDDEEGLVAALAASNKTLVPLKPLAVDITEI